MMPLLARFYGITVVVRWDDHPPPHVHVTYQGFSAALDIESLELVAGRLPRMVRALVLQWAMLHRTELRAAWNDANRLQRPRRIEPLE